LAAECLDRIAAGAPSLALRDAALKEGDAASSTEQPLGHASHDPAT
jgi:hypothetical protein